jgi:5-(carboxyamino)imidazole ribonucleotide mutase
VFGVPIAATALQGMDSLLSIAQMPKGIPVGTLAIGASGAANAALLAIAVLATTDAALREKLIAWRAARRDEVLAQTLSDEVGA